MLIPFELPFTRNLVLEKLYPELVMFFMRPLFTFFVFTIRLYHILYFIWVSGIILQSTKIFRTYLRFVKSIDHSLTIADTRIQNALNKINKEVKKPVSFQIIQTNMISTPMVLGFFKPLILIPQIELSEDEWGYIFEHEIAHYYHGDLWIKLLIELLCAIYWWNPFIYLLRKYVFRALEIHIDLLVTKHLSELKQIEYLECLIKLAKNHTGKRLDKLVLNFDNANTYTLSQRFNMVLEAYKQSSSKKRKSIFLGIIPLLLLLIMSFYFVFEPYSIAPQDASSTIEITKENSFLIPSEDGGYDLYFDAQYFGHVNEIKNSFPDIPIYNNIKEVPKNDTKK